MANFLQLTPENIAQARGMPWKEAFSQDFNPRNPNYRGFSTAYKGADRTGLGKYVTGGIKSLAGMFEPGSNVGGATPLTRKLALGAIDYAPKAMGTASKVLGPLSFLFNATPANADEINMTVEDFQNLALQNQTQPIDPTGRNLFTQYYEDDPYAGIQGQTAWLPEAKKLFDMYRKYKTAKSAYKNIKKYGPKVKKLITKKTPTITTAKGPPSITQIKKHKTPGGSGYGPHTKPKTKPKSKPIPDRNRGNIGGGGQKSSKTSAPQRDYSRHSAYGLKQGGLINFFKYGGFLG